MHILWRRWCTNILLRWCQKLGSIFIAKLEFGICSLRFGFLGLFQNCFDGGHMIEILGWCLIRIVRHILCVQVCIVSYDNGK